MSEVCVLLNIRDSTVRKLIKQDKIKTFRLGKKHIIPKSHLEGFI
ncbi:helix-turn-helix domain-containing protein [Chryseobacterium candidae]